MNSWKHIKWMTLAALFAVVMLPVAGFTQGYSRVRVVRLSFTQGTVVVQEPNSAEWAKAYVNTPVQQGFKVSTAEDSYAEVEFENGSTARIGENTLLEFTQLALAPDGSKVNHMLLDAGYGTFTIMPGRGDDYRVETPLLVVTPRERTQFRVDVEQGAERVEVFAGSVEVSGSAGTVRVDKNHVFEYEAGAANPSRVTKGLTEDAWDKWVQERQDATEAELGSQYSPNYSSYGWDGSGFYGWNELNYYGNWSYVPGYGYGWMPSGVPYGWMPYAIGNWSWYQGVGLTWISFEPWGWLPYHYGQWIFDPPFGWVWLPGNFGYWSPALVTWYEGPGWIGWSPAGSMINRHYTVAVSTSAFRRGEPVSPLRIVHVNPNQGRVVTRPDVPLQNRLPGPVAKPPAFLTQRGSPGLARHTNVIMLGTGAQIASGHMTHRLAGASPEAGPGRPGIVYDSHTGTFVNSGVAPAKAEPAPAKGAATGRLAPAGPRPATFNEPAPPAGKGVPEGFTPVAPRPGMHFFGARRAPSNGQANPFFNGGSSRRTMENTRRGGSFHAQPARGSAGRGWNGGGGFHSAPAASPARSAPAPRGGRP